MNKNSVVITAVLYGVAAGALAHAQAPAAPTGGPVPTKIAVINLSEAMARTKEGQKVAAEINSKFGPKKAEFDKRQTDIEQATEKLNKGRATMSDDAQKQLAADIQKKSTDLKRFGEDSQAEMDTDENRATADLQQKMGPILTQYAQQNNFAIVIDVGQQSPVLWYATATNITDVMVALYDQSHPVIGGAPATTAKPTPVVVAPSGSAPTPAPVRVATIFGQNAISSTQEGQKASAALTARFAPKRDEFNRKQAELQSLRDQLKKGQATMSAEALSNLNKSIDARNREAQRLGQDSQAALEEEEGAMMQQLGDKLMLVIRDYASRNGYAVVVDVSAPNGPVLWASPSIDITNEIVKLYDRTHPVAPTPPAAPPTKK